MLLNKEKNVLKKCSIKYNEKYNNILKVTQSKLHCKKQKMILNAEKYTIANKNLQQPLSSYLRYQKAFFIPRKLINEFTFEISKSICKSKVPFTATKFQ